MKKKTYFYAYENCFFTKYSINTSDYKVKKLKYTRVFAMLQFMENQNLKLFRPQELFGARNTQKMRTPYFDVGEFLPITDHNQLEIARICLASSTGDVISIRAQKTEAGYQIKVVDEYEAEFIDYQEMYTTIPTQGEIFNIIRDMNTESDSQYYWIQIVEMNELKTLNEITDFIYIDSNLYPNLNDLLIEFFSNNGYT